MTLLKAVAVTGIMIFCALSLKAQEATASIGNVVSSGGQISIPVTVSNFNDLGAITLFIDYDEDVLTYVDVQNSALDGISDNANDGVIGISWFNSSGAEGYDVEGILFEMVFEYQNGYSALTFVEEDCEITDFELTEIPVEYSSGEVSSSIPAEVEIENRTFQEPGTVVQSSLNCDFSKADIPVGSFEFHVQYNQEMLQYQGAEEFAFPDMIVESVEDEAKLIISWSSASGTIYSGKLLELNFLFQGGFASLNFDTLTSYVRNLDSQQMPAVYDNGAINEGLATMIDNEFEGSAFSGDGLKLQLSPNPVINQANLSYSLQVDGRVSIKLFTTNAFHVTTLFNRFQSKGEYSFSFLPGKYNLKAGLYLILIEVNTKDTYHRSILKFILGHTGGAFHSGKNTEVPVFNAPSYHNQVCSALFTTKKV